MKSIFFIIPAFFAISSFARDAPLPDVPVGDDEFFLVNKFGFPECEFINSRHDFIGVYYRGKERVYTSNTPEFKYLLLRGCSGRQARIFNPALK